MRSYWVYIPSGLLTTVSLIAISLIEMKRTAKGAVKRDPEGRSAQISLEVVDELAAGEG